MYANGCDYVGGLSLAEVRGRTFRSTIVKTAIREFYGDRPNQRTWINWRKWARHVAADMGGDTAPIGQDFSFDEFCCLAVIAQIRRAESDGRHYELSGLAIKKRAAAPKFQEMMAGLIAAIDREFTLGSDAHLALRPHGIDVCYRTVARRVPGFSARKLYRIADLIGWLK
jgi:hypothetical protein